MQLTRGTGFLENFLSKTRAKKATQLISKNLRTGNILDIGCGSIPFFLLNTKFNKKFGIDPEAKTSPSNKIKIDNNFILAGKPLPHEDSSFNIIVSLGTLEHFNDETLLHIFRESHRLLNQNGKLILTSPAPWTYNLMVALSNIRIISPQEVKDATQIRSTDTVRILLEASGFKKENIQSNSFLCGLNRWFTATK